MYKKLIKKVFSIVMVLAIVLSMAMAIAPLRTAAATPTGTAYVTVYHLDSAQGGAQLGYEYYSYEFYNNSTTMTGGPYTAKDFANYGTGYLEGTTSTTSVFRTFGPRHAGTVVFLYDRTSYTITYNANDNTSSPANVSVTVAKDSNHTVSNPSFTRSNYTVTSFNTAGDGTGENYDIGSSFTPDKNITLYAQWTPNPTVTYYPNGGTGLDTTVSVGLGASHTVSNPDFSRENYTLAGFNTESDGAGTHYTIGLAFTVNKNEALYAQWILNSHAVTYYPNGGTGSAVKIFVNYGESHTVASQSFTRDNYTLTGFNTASGGSGTQYKAGQSFIVSSDVALYAHWTQNPYTVTYDPNGGTGSAVEVKVNPGASHTVTDQGYARDGGYALTGFNTAANGSGTQHRIGQTFNVSNNITLYAQWNRIFNITYVVSLPSGRATRINREAGEGSTYVIENLSQLGVSLGSNMTFLSWNTRADGGGVTYRPGAEYMVTKPLILYARISK